MITCTLYEQDFMLYSSELSNGDSSILQCSPEEAFTRKTKKDFPQDKLYLELDIIGTILRDNKDINIVMPKIKYFRSW